MSGLEELRPVIWSLSAEGLLHQIYLYFVLDGLDSREAWFEGAFHNKAQQASEFAKSLSHNVKRGREGRFLAGYNPGGGSYGYKNVPDEDLTQRGEYGRPKVHGVFQVVDPEEAAIVERILQAFASGMSLGKIAKMLNDEGVPSSQDPRVKGKRSWSKTAILTI